MRILNARDGFPALEPIQIGLFYKHQRLSGAGLMLVDSLIPAWMKPPSLPRIRQRPPDKRASCGH